MLVICCGMPRSGSTLTYQIAAHLIERAGLGRRPAGWPTPIEPHMAAAPRPVFLAKVHDPHPAEPSLDPRFTRYLYSHRDVRDALASHLQKTGDLPADQIAPLVQHRFLTPFAHFTTCPGVLISRYDDLTTNLPAEIRRIAAHLDIPIADEAAAALAASLSLANQRRRAAAVPDDAPWDNASLLHRNHINDARSGKFADVLAPDQLAETERVAARWLTDNNYPPPTTPTLRRA